MSSKPSSAERRAAGGEEGEDGRRRRSGERAGKGREDKQGKPLVRQGSFTIDRPSGNVPLELIPRIGQQGGAAGPRRGSSGSLDTSALLKDTQAVMAFLEAKLRDDPPAEGEVSPESDIDTASTVSQAAGEAERKATPKRRTLSSLHREKSTAGSAAKAAPPPTPTPASAWRGRPSSAPPRAGRSPDAPPSRATAAASPRWT
ncbi:hypothetical protein ANANG_G00049890 [Anguilla anguilla]|uniref:CEP170 C-terminal domain-containing protein n=1 Tax=Anguilla anguilla TaxID=7936 RepID=A0A9D3MV65_ANGAN|nr:hypothetical protein ANANG_G00049890 [Anguilla anguilla]